MNKNQSGRPSSNQRSGQTHKTTCDQCKRGCEVPFKPTGNKPVLCRDCFNEKRFNDEPREFKGNRSKSDSPKTTPDSRILKSIKSDVESLTLKVDSLTRNLKIVTDYIQQQNSKTSLNDVMKNIGVLPDSKNSHSDE